MGAMTQQQAADRQRWDAVRKWHGLRGEAKLAWQYLWNLANGRARTIDVHPGSVGADQGANDSRTGKNHLKTLAAAGLIQVVDSYEELRRCQVWKIYVEDPLEVMAMRLKKISADPQGVLFAEEPDEKLLLENKKRPPSVAFPQTGAQYLAQDLAQDIASPNVITFNIDARATHQKPERILKDIGDATSCARSCAQTSAGDADGKAPPNQPLKTPGPRITPAEPEPTEVGFAIAESFHRFADSAIRSQEVKQEDVKQLAERISGLVGPKLYPSVAERLASEVVFGVYPIFALEGLLRSFSAWKLGEGDGQTPENWSKCFVGLAKKSFKEHGLPWRKKPVESEPAASPPAKADTLVAAVVDPPTEETLSPKEEIPATILPPIPELIGDAISAAVFDALRLRIGEGRFQSWFAGRTRLERSQDGFTVYAKNKVCADFMKGAFRADFHAVILEVAGSEGAVRFAVDPNAAVQVKAKSVPTGIVPNVGTVVLEGPTAGEVLE